MAEPRDHYKVLQVDPAADADVIAAAYRALARRLHPDADSSAPADRRMTELNRAYEVLRDPTLRAAYDAQRPKEPVPAPAPPEGSGLTARWRAQRGAGAPTDGTSVLNFGRYQGMSLREIAKRDVEYLNWLSRHSSGIRFRKEIAEILAGRSAQRAADRPAAEASE